MPTIQTFGEAKEALARLVGYAAMLEMVDLYSRETAKKFLAEEHTILNQWFNLPPVTSIDLSRKSPTELIHETRLIQRGVLQYLLHELHEYGDDVPWSMTAVVQDLLCQIMLTVTKAYVGL
ncbi:MAG TPA: hypothetical protein VFQ60_00945 [Patescibacteria group bacterium]|nr:hypothetical protein [Patescibacteria group bacterium]